MGQPPHTGRGPHSGGGQERSSCGNHFQDGEFLDAPGDVAGNTDLGSDDEALCAPGKRFDLSVSLQAGESFTRAAVSAVVEREMVDRIAFSEEAIRVLVVRESRLPAPKRIAICAPAGMTARRCPQWRGGPRRGREPGREAPR